MFKSFWRHIDILVENVQRRKNLRLLDWITDFRHGIIDSFLDYLVRFLSVSVINFSLFLVGKLGPANSRSNGFHTNRLVYDEIRREEAERRRTGN